VPVGPTVLRVLHPTYRRLVPGDPTDLGIRLLDIRKAHQDIRTFEPDDLRPSHTTWLKPVDQGL